jgi:hypothetical protein
MAGAALNGLPEVIAKVGALVIGGSLKAGAGVGEVLAMPRKPQTSSVSVWSTGATLLNSGG